MNLSGFRNLLHILHKYHSELPLDPRTLLKNDILVESLEIENFDEGQFVYFGIGNSIKKCYDFFDLLTHNTILLDINIDGVPVYRSGKKVFGQFCVTLEIQLVIQETLSRVFFW